MIETFLGKQADYWFELDRRFANGGNNLERADLLEEVVQLQAKVSFYESRIKQTASRLPRP